MTIVRASSRGRVVIPAEIRRRLGLGKGTPFVVDEKDGTITLRPARQEYFDRLAGVLPRGPSLAKALAEEHAKDRQREDE